MGGCRNQFGPKRHRSIRENRMTAYTSVANPVWFVFSRTMIVVDVVFPHLGETPVKFNASPQDSMQYGREIYADIIAGKYGPIAEHAA
jgi:hypothetical protein